MKKKFGVINPIVVKTEGDLVTIERAGRKMKLQKSEIKAVRVERRTFRGHTLVVETHNKPLYLKQSEGAVEDAYKYLLELTQ